MFVLALLFAGTAAEGQQARELVLTGRVVGPDSQPVAGATVRAILGTTTYVVRTNDAGRYRLAPMADGSWTVAVQAVGHIALFERLAFDGPVMERDFHIKRVQTELAPVFVEGNWSGVRGFVVDERGFAPLGGARIEVVSKGGEVLATDSGGRFTIEKPDGYDVRLLVEREGYARRVVMAKATRLAAERLVIRLDTLWEPQRDWIAGQDLRSRMQQASPMAALVSGDEIREAGGLPQAPSITAKGIMDFGCLFVNGVAKPDGYPFDLKEIDFVEVYPAGSEHSGTLAARWPVKKRGVCETLPGNYVRATGPGPFTVVWLKTKPPPPPAPRPE